ncbi:MAG: OsmC family protein [Thermoanaerobaculia bacterium]
MSKGKHGYEARLVWDGNGGDGTSDYRTYGRQHRVMVPGKPTLDLTADPAFRGDPARHDPEDLLLAALSSCHLLSYLALCAKHRISVVAYEDHASGTMQEDHRGGGRFTEVVLRPRVALAPGTSDANLARALALHERAHELCFIAASCNFPIRHEPEVR